MTVIRNLIADIDLVLAAAGVSVMIANKALHSGQLLHRENCMILMLKYLSTLAPHFTSWHGKFGLITSILLILQALIGVLIAYDPGMRLLGGEGKAKSLWKYHSKLDMGSIELRPYRSC